MVKGLVAGADGRQSAAAAVRNRGRDDQLRSGLQNIGVRAFVRGETAAILRGMDTAVFANVFGYAVEDYVEVVRVLEDAEGLGRL